MKNQKGITLIALIITIIVMLILVGVSVSTAINTGLFKTASGVSQNTQKQRDNELLMSEGQANLDGTFTDIEDYVNGLKPKASVPIPEDLDVGDLIAYTPSSQYTESNRYNLPAEYAGCSAVGQTECECVYDEEGSLVEQCAMCSGDVSNDGFYTDMDSDVEWKVIAKEGDTIKIIPNAVSTTELHIGGAHGWNNSIKALNDVCGKIYGSDDTTYYTATAKSIEFDDIKEITGYNSASPSNKYILSYSFPIDYLITEKGMSESDFTDAEKSSGLATRSNIEVTDTAYSYEANEQENFKNWINLGAEYWLASRYISVYSDGEYSSATFYVDYVWYPWDKCYIRSCSDGMAGSGPENGYHVCAVRPVVTLTLHQEPKLVNGVWAFGE